MWFFFSKSVSPEDSEKKRANYQAYRSYLNREGPRALGSKEIPQVSANISCRNISRVIGISSSIGPSNSFQTFSSLSPRPTVGHHLYSSQILYNRCAFKARQLKLCIFADKAVFRFAGCSASQKYVYTVPKISFHFIMMKNKIIFQTVLFYFSSLWNTAAVAFTSTALNLMLPIGTVFSP